MQTNEVAMGPLIPVLYDLFTKFLLNQNSLEYMSIIIDNIKQAESIRDKRHPYIYFTMGRKLL